jgi:hypothetical protein
MIAGTSPETSVSEPTLYAAFELEEGKEARTYTKKHEEAFV